MDGITRAVTAVGIQAGSAWFASLFNEKDTWAFRVSRRVVFQRRPIKKKDGAWLLQGLRYAVHILYTGKKRGPALHGVDVLMKGVPSSGGPREYSLITYAYVPSQDCGDQLHKAAALYKRFKGRKSTERVANTALGHMLSLESKIRRAGDPWLVEPNRPFELSGHAVLLKETVLDFADLHHANITIELYGTFSTMEKDDRPSRALIGALAFSPCQLDGPDDGEFTSTADDPYIVPVST